MYYNREQHKRFLDKELMAISEKYLKLLNSEAIALLSNNEVYVTQFIKMRYKKEDLKESDCNVLGSSQLMLRFKKDKGIPRKNEYFTAVVIEKDMCLPKNWGTITWGKLRNHQIEFSEVHCVWQGKADDKGFLLCGFSGISIEMAKYMENKEGCVVILGPQEPPIDYYQNLISLVMCGGNNMAAKEILDFDKKTIVWNPININSNKEQVDDIIESLNEESQLIFQGPPGTGKTYLMAELVATLLNNNKSVLVTAMTNRALIELAEKESLSGHLNHKNVMKTNVSVDEQITCKNLVSIDSKEVTCMPGKLTLSTFYNTSGWATKCYNECPFDYIIMDEASQALLGMIAACKNLGRKVIWIGDQNQMQPIVSLSDDTLVRNDYYMLVNGFRTLISNFEYKSYILTETHRLLPKSAQLTSLFYHTPLKSVARFQYMFENSTHYYLKEEGCSLLLKNMPVGEKADVESCEYVINILEGILLKDKNLKIAILSKFRTAVRLLQNCFISKYGNKDNVLIDTVERVQGMTCHVCIYFIPNTMMQMSLDKALFNVATSRAMQKTLIVADPSILMTNCDKQVRMYLMSIATGNIPRPIDDAIATEGNRTIEVAGIKLRVKGKIDLSKFERPRNEIKTDKINYYIIDTNVFVNCPDIISKIDKKYPIILSAKVTDELDKMKIKLDEKGKSNAEKALRLLNNESSHKIVYEFADVSLLPDDFDKRSPDNMILSVALKYKDENPIMLTSDNGLQLKSKILGLSTISLKVFLKR